MAYTLPPEPRPRIPAPGSIPIIYRNPQLQDLSFNGHFRETERS